MSYSKIIILGRLGKDPEIKATSAGAAVCKFSVATSKKWTDKQGQKHEKTSWHNCICFGNLASIASQYLRQGREVFIEGEVDYQEYEKDGVKKFFTQIIVQQLTFIGGSEDRKTDQQAPPVHRQDNSNFGGTNYSKKGGDGIPQSDFFSHDDIPF